MKPVVFGRYRLLGFFFSACAALILLQMIRIQTSASAKAIGDVGKSYSFVHKKIFPERGSIFDRWGHLLAGNTEVYEVGVDTRYVRSPETIAATVSSILGLDYTKVYDQVKVKTDKSSQEYLVLTDFVTPDKIEKLAALKDKYNQQMTSSSGEKMPSLLGLLWSPHLMRSYPEKALASNILGFYSFLDRDKGRGYFGVEEKYNELLSGTPQDVMVPLDPYLMKEMPSVPPGSSLVLTIDREIQAMLERVLDKAVKESNSASGTVIISDPKTGEVLAMATTPHLDPNQYWTYADIFPKPTPFNRAVGETYEPGSVFKVLTMSSAIDAGVVTPTTPFLDTGSIEVGGLTIFNWDRGAWGPQDMTGCMRHSLNVCLAWVASQMGPTRFYDYMQRFGIGHRTNVDLGGEVLWPLAIPGDSSWYPMNLGTNAFGQGLAVTPMQMVMSVSALANDGKMMAPHVLKAVIDNKQQYNNTPQVVGTPITAKTARDVTEMLAVSLEQEASDALVPGYRVAGKTGTGEIPTPNGYTSGLTNASFVGWGPVSDPRFLVYIWLEKPESSIWGSVVAAPVFSEIVQNLVVLMDIPPDEVQQQLTAK